MRMGFLTPTYCTMTLNIRANVWCQGLRNIWLGRSKRVLVALRWQKLTRDGVNVPPHRRTSEKIPSLPSSRTLYFLLKQYWNGELWCVTFIRLCLCYCVELFHSLIQTVPGASSKGGEGILGEAQLVPGSPAAWHYGQGQQAPRTPCCGSSPLLSKS